MGPKRRRQDAGVVEEAPRPTSEENLDVDLVEDDDPRTFLDAFTDDLAGDGDLSDTEIDYGNESGDEDIDHADESDIPGDESDEDVRVVRPRKQKFKNLDEVMDESKYHPLPEQVPESHTWKPSKNDTTSKSYEWTTDFHPQGRAPRRNLIRNQPGPSPQAKQCINLAQLFDQFITDDMINGIVQYTNSKIDSVIADHPQWESNIKRYSYLKHTDPLEIRAWIGLLYTRAVLRQNLISVKRLYQHQHANPIFKSIMSENRFVFLTGLIQFDDTEDRAERWESDRFAAFRDFFNAFNDHCGRMRVPGDVLSLDETLYPFRGRIGIKQYNPNKPAKYGLLYRSISDAERPYTYNTLPYAGKPNTITPYSEYVTGTDNYTKYLVKGLERRVDIRGRNLSIDRFFTSVTIAEWLLDRGLTVVGTLRTDRKGIPEAVKKVDNREDKNTKFFFCEDISSLLVSYVVKKKKGWNNVLVLSTMHKNVHVTQDERMKPDVITFYDHTKGGVDIMDQMAGFYSTRMKTHRWTMNAMAYVLDTVRTVRPSGTRCAPPRRCVRMTFCGPSLSN